REKWGVKEGEFVFGRIGKTAWELLGTFKDVVDKHPNVRLISLGENHDFQHIVDALPEHVRSRIVPLPPTNSDEELRLFYSSIDALLHWSYVGESFGMVLAEAIGCGTPVVMPLQLDKDIGGIEVIGHGEGGLIAGHGAILDQAALEMIRTRASFDNGPLQRARERMNREYEVNRVAAKAIEAFHLALDAKQNHRSLQDAFAERSEFVSFVSKKWFKDLISKRIGPTTLREQIRHRFTHNGWLVRARYRVVPPLPPETVLLSPAVVNSKAC
ncbi:MAG TPA: glycosyltransferase, partial [Tepidisphaeraceae bacterium]|nr:glycosyltransferase [Tepidisphaeraceae bacterium]